MSGLTSKGLILPVDAENQDVSIINANSQRVNDYAMGAFICTSTTRPTGSNLWDGMIIKETDTKRVYQYDAIGAAWVYMVPYIPADIIENSVSTVQTSATVGIGIVFGALVTLPVGIWEVQGWAAVNNVTTLDTCVLGLQEIGVGIVPNSNGPAGISDVVATNKIATLSTRIMVFTVTAGTRQFSPIAGPGGSSRVQSFSVGGSPSSIMRARRIG